MAECEKEKEKEKVGLLPVRGWNILKADRLSRCIPCHADVIEDLARCVAAPATKATFCWVNFPYFPWRNAKDKEKEGFFARGRDGICEYSIRKHAKDLLG